MCMFRESTPAENRTTTMLVSCAMQAEPRDCRNVLEMATTTELYCFWSPCIGITLGIQRSRGIGFYPCLVIFEENNESAPK